jgi:hypothetical protein
MSSPDPGASLGLDAPRLFEVARESIRLGVLRGHPLRPDPLAFSAPLRELRSSFVTLRLVGELRGCVGGLEPRWPLVSDVARHAFAAGFRDPRFPPVDAAEFAALEVEISVLSPLEPLSFACEAELLAQLRPGIDGLVLEVGARRGTFLPSVWEQLPTPCDFLAELKRKAGLAADSWPHALVVYRYTVESLSETGDGRARTTE